MIAIVNKYKIGLFFLQWRSKDVVYLSNYLVYNIFLKKFCHVEKQLWQQIID